MDFGRKLVSVVLFSFAGTAFALDLESPDFVSGGRLPPWTATAQAGGENRSPALVWKNVPPVTQSLALIVVDEHPVAQRWIHWIVVNIDPGTSGFSRGASAGNGGTLSSGIELINTFGSVGWGGPEPPAGSGKHTYAFYLYALKVPRLDVEGELTWAEFQALVKGKIVAHAKLVGTLTLP